MSSNPYENEPGFEDANEAQDKKNQKEYVQKVLVTSAIFTYEQPLTLTLDPP
jgi:ubiquitin-conjugating enzyme E2 Z